VKSNPDDASNVRKEWERLMMDANPIFERRLTFAESFEWQLVDRVTHKACVAFVRQNFETTAWFDLTKIVALRLKNLHSDLDNLNAPTTTDVAILTAVLKSAIPFHNL
jgi:hypothetical protein